MQNKLLSLREIVSFWDAFSLYYQMKRWFEDSSDHCSFIPFIQGWYKDQKDRDHNFTNFARYEMNYLKKIFLLLFTQLAGDLSEFVHMPGHWSTHGDARAYLRQQNLSIFWIRGKKEVLFNWRCISGILPPARGAHWSTAPEDGSMAVPVLMAITTLPALHHCSGATLSIQTGLSSLSCTMLKQWSPSSFQHWHIWKSLDCDSGLALKVSPQLGYYHSPL